jgi:hypothetical protein
MSEHIASHYARFGERVDLAEGPEFLILPSPNPERNACAAIALVSGLLTIEECRNKAQLWPSLKSLYQGHLGDILLSDHEVDATDGVGDLIMAYLLGEQWEVADHLLQYMYGRGPGLCESDQTTARIHPDPSAVMWALSRADKRFREQLESGSLQLDELWEFICDNCSGALPDMRVRVEMEYSCEVCGLQSETRYRDENYLFINRRSDGIATNVQASLSAWCDVCKKTTVRQGEESVVSVGEIVMVRYAARIRVKTRGSETDRWVKDPTPTAATGPLVRLAGRRLEARAAFVHQGTRCEGGHFVCRRKLDGKDVTMDDDAAYKSEDRRVGTDQVNMLLLRTRPRSQLADPERMVMSGATHPELAREGTEPEGDLSGGPTGSPAPVGGEAASYSGTLLGFVDPTGTLLETQSALAGGTDGDPLGDASADTPSVLAEMMPLIEECIVPEWPELQRAEFIAPTKSRPALQLVEAPSELSSAPPAEGYATGEAGHRDPRRAFGDAATSAGVRTVGLSTLAGSTRVDRRLLLFERFRGDASCSALPKGSAILGRGAA